MKKNVKVKSYEQGHKAEKLAAFYLTLKGYKILRTRYKTPVGEIDVIAKKGNVIVMVEVKMRASEGSALEAVSSRNRYRVGQAAKYFLAAHPGYCALDLRFDVIVMGRPLYFRHLDNAWQEGS